MKNYESAVITAIHPPRTVFSQKGRIFQMGNRKTYGLSLCLRGQIRYVMNGKEFISHPGNAVLLPKGGSYLLYGEKEGIFTLINFDCAHFACDEVQVFPLQEPKACIQVFSEINAAFLRHENRLKIFSAFYNLLSMVFFECGPEHTPFHALIHYIQDNLSNPELTNTVLAEKMGISEVYFRKRFYACFHMTPKQYILDLRIRKAKQLLADTHKTVTAVAEACGFSSLYHFCKVFKDRTGLTPSQFAAQNRVFRI